MVKVGLVLTKLACTSAARKDVNMHNEAYDQCCSSEDLDSNLQPGTS